MTRPDAPVGTVTRVETGTVVLDLPEVLTLGTSRIARREYLAVAVHDADGRVGRAYCLTRDTPIEAIVRTMLIPHLLGSGGTVGELAERMARATALVGRVGLVRRAIGLLEIALWDLAGITAGQPCWRMLGTDDSPRDALLVAAYPAEGRSAATVAAEVLGHASEKWPLVKISRTPDRPLMRELLATLDRELPSGTGVVVDVGFAWRDSAEALDEIAAWDAPELAWLEDPLVPEDAEGIAAIRRSCGQRVGAGDEVTDPRVLQRLIDEDSVDVLRVDVVAIGGLVAALDAAAVARAAGRQVSTHISPEASVHLGTMVETFARREPAVMYYDPSASLVVGGPEFRDGRAIPPRAPGLGMGLDPRFGLDA